ncbi:MAG: hypothetical protein K6G71_08345 [Clostridiales bacterium]|nr:hypothetical protein [Clostridiales bacterium]
MQIKKYPTEYIENQRMIQENRLPARTLLIPAQKRGVTHKNYSESDRVRLLSGDWKFCYLEEDNAEPFYLPDISDADWDTLPVPSMWQFHGYGTCYYSNVRYCFPYDPPYIRRSNPVGLYRASFTANRSARSVLRFLGVDNAYFVWLNGQYVGFSKGSRIPAEFDVTDKLNDGENLLAVKVYTFSDASYLENQDMLMASGIFRDVMLISSGENSLWDYTVIPGESGFNVKYSCSVSGKTPADIRFTLCDRDGKEMAAVKQTLTGSGEVFLPVENAVYWNAEEPYLYTVYIEIEENCSVTETHTKKVGITKSEIEGCYLMLNGSPITLKGVNRHENNAKRGRAITAEQIEAELRDIKDNNLNAIRCSHYTNQPLFYELCSEYGIYVMDEADCETHGAECCGDQGALNKDESWSDAFFDRSARMYEINKNETCVNIRSPGNECGAGCNFERCAAWLRTREVAKPLNNNQLEDTDRQFAQTGYMPMKTLFDSVPEDGPLLMLEYGHAMGNSPGGLEDIWDWVYENENCCGGYVWEYKSHGFYVPGRDGRPRYLYGGDFPDRYHWSNFSLDGYHTSDGTPKPSWGELKEVSSPVHVRWEDGGVSVKNTYDFKTLDGVIMLWTVSADGAPVRKGEAAIDGLAARRWKRIELQLSTDGLRGIVTADCVFLQNGKVIAHKQKILADVPRELPAPLPFPHTVTDDGERVTVKGGDFTVGIKKGLLSYIERGGKVLLDSPMRLNCHRAPTDNDGAIFEPNHAREWRDALVHTMRFGCRDVKVGDSPERVTVTAVGRFLPHSHYWGFDTKIVYRITAGGETDVSVDMEPYGRGPDLLGRVGAVFELDGSFNNCRWLGRGPGESYPDCKANAHVGVYSANVADMNFAYDVPQETGNREDCRGVTVFGDPGALTFTGAFSFSLHDFTLDALTAARHCDELEKSEKRYLYIDCRQRGLGSHSCGPEPEEKYELRMGRFAWQFSVKASPADQDKRI